MSVLPGEKTDGSGKICIHLFVQDEKGPFVQHHILHPATDKNGDVIKGQLMHRPTRGRLACGVIPAPTLPTSKSNIIKVTHRTDEPRAVTCPRCQESDSYKTMMQLLEKG